MACGGQQTFTCKGPRGKSLKWTISGLQGINKPIPFLARREHIEHPKGRITTNDTGDGTQTKISVITILRFTESDVGGIIQCINVDDNKIIGMATISMRECVCTMEVLIDMQLKSLTVFSLHTLRHIGPIRLLC